MKTTWEESQEQYSMLLDGLNDLIRHTTKLAESYEATNMTFAHLIYENGLTEIIQKTKMLEDYERGFQFMHYSLQGHVESLKRLRERVNLVLIKDPVNRPHN